MPRSSWGSVSPLPVVAFYEQAQGLVVRLFKRAAALSKPSRRANQAKIRIIAEMASRSRLEEAMIGSCPLVGRMVG